MGYKGTMRSIGAAMRAAERDSKRKQREYEKRAKQLQKMQALERAEFEVEQYENELEVKVSLHKELSGYNWIDIGKPESPVEPTYANKREVKARQKLETFKPGFFDKVFGGEMKKVEELENKLEKSIRKDKNDYEKLLEVWEKDVEEYKQLKNLYNGITV